MDVIRRIFHKIVGIDTLHHQNDVERTAIVQIAVVPTVYPSSLPRTRNPGEVDLIALHRGIRSYRKVFSLLRDIIQGERNDLCRYTVAMFLLPQRFGIIVCNGSAYVVHDIDFRGYQPRVDNPRMAYLHQFEVEQRTGIEVTRRTPDIECYGAYVLDPDTGKIDTFLSRVTLLATGGVGAVYSATTNPNIATGDGIAMAYRAKATVQGMEFIQFHPTALFHHGETHPAYLITEAMRGYGGVLRLPNGEQFMQKYDKRLSLAPRDIVARAIDKEMKIHGLDHVCLDVTHKDPEETKHHFPNIYKKCLSIGIDITKDYIPVVPCAHYLCGGIKVDLNACSSINRLYAVGECSCTGLHGGNRLASNSLIEAVVYAKAAADHSLANIDKYDFNTRVPEWNDEGTMTNEEKVLVAQDVKEVGQTMSNYVGIVRSDLRLKRAWTRLDILYEETEELFKRVKATRDICELRNMINVGYLITRQAIERKESRGLHYTIDYPKHAYDQK